MYINIPAALYPRLLQNAAAAVSAVNAIAGMFGSGKTKVLLHMEEQCDQHQIAGRMCGRRPDPLGSSQTQKQICNRPTAATAD